MSRTGKTLVGRYLLEEHLGCGAMGDVYAARHLLLCEPAAIKFLKVNAVARPDALARLLQEARATMRLRSPHAVRVYDVLVDEEGCPCLVMERLFGLDLAKSLITVGAFEISQAVDYLLQACHAIAEAHGIGIVHRDLKPSNLYLARTPDAPPNATILKVLDFGIAKETRRAPVTLAPGAQAFGALTDPGPLGSPFYMSPEQMESARETDARTDVWALGVTLFELVTGRPPFGGSTLIQIYTQMIARGAPWRSALSGLPHGLEDVIATCLRPNREDRYANAHELARALAPYAPHRPSGSPLRVPTRHVALSQEAQAVADATGFRIDGTDPVRPSGRPPEIQGRDGPRGLDAEETPAFMTATLKSHPSEGPTTSADGRARPRGLAAPRRAWKAIRVTLPVVALLVIAVAAWARHTEETHGPSAPLLPTVRGMTASAAGPSAAGAGVATPAAPPENAGSADIDRPAESGAPSEARRYAPNAPALALIPMGSVASAYGTTAAGPSRVASKPATRPTASPDAAAAIQTETQAANTAEAARSSTAGPPELDGRE